MKKRFFIVGVLLLLVSCAHAQKKVAGDIKLADEMPVGWGKSVAADVAVLDVVGDVVKKVSTVVRAGKELAIDISSMQPGKYTLQVTPKNQKLHPNDFSRYFEKVAGNKRVVLKLTPCVRYKKHDEISVKKPVIYLYPEQTQDVAVQVHFKGRLTETIPAYNGGWQVTARPGGGITNKADGKEYPYLFWEGDARKQDWPMENGSVVSADSSRAFLERMLPAIGLVAKEYSEFIEFWLPVLQKNEYNLIHFAGSDYDAMAPLEITPKPDAVLRVFMVFKPVDRNTRAVPQQFDGFVRKGFTVVEWGGAQLDGMKVVGR